MAYLIEQYPDRLW